MERDGRNDGGRSVRRPDARMDRVGIVEWFHPGEQDRVEHVVSGLQALGVHRLRTGVSWADWHTAQGHRFYQWLLPRLARDFDLLPCFVYTPPSLGVVPATSSPPRNLRAYADFLDQMVNEFDRCFEWVEIWNEPNNLREWDWTIDRNWEGFCTMLGMAAHWMHHRGRKVLLGGMSPVDPNWLAWLFQRDAMEHVDAVGIHGFPGTWEFTWRGWEPSVRAVREMLGHFGSKAEVWITEAGFSTWRYQQREQMRAFQDAVEAPVERMYWYGLQDLDPDLPTVDGFHSDEREYHFGIQTAAGQPKLLYRLWQAGGAEAVADGYRLTEPPRVLTRRDRPVLITGGAGFIGTNLANRLASDGRTVLLYDNLSRPGVEHNLAWLREVHGQRVQVLLADVRDRFTLRSAVREAEQVFHFAAQVAVTTSLADPLTDFEINARGTLHLLEAIRSCPTPPPVVFTSTNKVYGGLPDVPLEADGSRYDAVDAALSTAGIDERRGLDFHSPYGCSKGSADQYVIDYARTYDLPAVVFRMSCIYGPHQFGTEDQGWVAHFLIRALRGEPITIYGDGMQVRDILFVEDLVEAFLLAQANVGRLSGRAFNIGGGPRNTISLLELLDLIERLHGRRPQALLRPWRPGDQRYYVSDTRRFERAAGWKRRVGVHEGVRRLYEWLAASQRMRRLPLSEPTPERSGVVAGPALPVREAPGLLPRPSATAARTGTSKG